MDDYRRDTTTRHFRIRQLRITTTVIGVCINILLQMIWAFGLRHFFIGEGMWQPVNIVLCVITVGIGTLITWLLFNGWAKEFVRDRNGELLYEGDLVAVYRRRDKQAHIFYMGVVQWAASNNKVCVLDIQTEQQNYINPEFVEWQGE
jgi:hypothetical protein